jgi:hypothetical protein
MNDRVNLNHFSIEEDDGIKRELPEKSQAEEDVKTMGVARAMQFVQLDTLLPESP